MSAFSAPRLPRLFSLLRTLAALALGGVCLGLVLYGLDLQQVGRALAGAEPAWIGLALLAITGTLLARTGRWQVLLDAAGASFGRTWRALLLGQMANVVLPARGGDVVRIGLLAREGSIPVARVLASVAAEKVWDLLALCATAAGLLALGPLPAWFTGPLRGLALALTLALPAAVALLLARPSLLAWLRPRLARLGPAWAGRLLRLVDSLAGGLDSLRRPALAARALAWTVAIWSLGALANWATMRALGLADWRGAVFLLAVLMAGLAVPTTPARLGVFEGLVVLTLAAVPRGTALAVALLLHAVVLLPPALGAAAAALFWGRNRRMQPAPECLAPSPPAPPQPGAPTGPRAIAQGAFPVATVIIPAYNAAPTIAPCLQALHEQTVPWESLEVIVVDDGSTDGTAAVAEQAGARVVRMDHAGPAAARNAGAGAAHSSLLLFTDADCAPGPRWVESLLQALADAGTAGAKGTYRTEQRGLVPRFVQQEYEDRYARLERQESIDFVDTYAAAYRRDVFLANSGFDPVFPVPSVEDQELSFRLARKGYCLRFAPAAWVWHQHDADLAEYVRRKFGIGYWKALLLHRHPERAVHDSHTPPVLRAQIGLMALLLLGLPLLLPWPALWPLPAAVAAALLLSAVPFTLRCARRDPPVALLAPLLLGARALALGCGLLAGLLRFALYPLPAPAGTRPVARLLKRSLDLLGATLGLVLAGPVILLLGLLVRLDSSGPAFFVQERVGQNGRVFGMFKLRSMVHGSEAPAAEVDPAAMDPPIPKPAEDPRVTRLGRFLRRWSLDELPQFFNVLKGEMSLVGPRPEEVRIVRRYADWHRRLLLARPGMTGPMQINGRGDLSLDRRVELELAYIDHYSLWRDLGILARTIPAVVSGKGAR